MKAISVDPIKCKNIFRISTYDYIFVFGVSIKTLISNLVRTTCFWNNLHQVRSISKISKIQIIGTYCASFNDFSLGFWKSYQPKIAIKSFMPKGVLLVFGITQQQLWNTIFRRLEGWVCSKIKYSMTKSRSFTLQ